MENIKNQLFTTPILRVLDFFLQNSGKELSDTEVTCGVTGVKRAAIHQALIKLNTLGILERTRRSRQCYNTPNSSLAWLIPFQITSNILAISPLIKELERTSVKIVLFGSRAAGTGRYDSDFDLLVVSTNPSEVMRITNNSTLSEQLQLIIKTPEEMINFESSEPVLIKKIHEGIILWEK